MFSSFSRLLPNNVSISAPDFLKQAVNANGNSNGSTNGHGNGNINSTPASQAVPTSRTKQTGPGVGETQTSSKTGVENESANSAEGLRKDKKKRKDAATETFIIVRPPPSMSNHPLNLQVQLVSSSGISRDRKQRSGSTSSTRDPTNLKSSNESRETLNDTEYGSALQRTISTRSDTESTYSASSTLSTFNSSTSSSGRRMIPLYNLHAHNVMTNVITDAGTDAKIAKFFKRGLEIMGLAMLEPVEVYGRYSWNEEIDSLNPYHQVTRTTSNLSRTIPPTPSQATTDLPTVLEVPSSPTTPKPGEKETPKKLFGNLFKKKKDPPAPLSLPDSSTPVSSKRKSNTPSVVVLSPSAQQTVISTPTTASMILPSGNEVVLQSQILGLQAVLQSPVVPPKGRPSTYVWVVRKWIKGSNEGLLEQLGGQIGGAMNALGSNVGNMLNTTTGGGSGFTIPQPGGINGVLGGIEVEVRFEWKRGSRKGERRRKMATGSTIGGGGGEEQRERRYSMGLDAPVSSSAAAANPRFSINLEPDPTPTATNKRLSFQGFGKKSASTKMTTTTTEKDANGSNEHLGPKYSRTSSPNPPPSVTTTGTTEENNHGGGGGGKRGAGDDNGEESESDPEDSERPWNCYLHIRALPTPTGLGLGLGLMGGSKTASRTHSKDELSAHDSDHSHDHAQRGEEMLDIKLRVACLAPAPHHPKVVAQIKTPYPLPDVLFDSRPGGIGATFRDRDRDESNNTNLELGKEGVEKGTLLLTAEEIKDVVSCTGLWLVVREGYGGLARKRKGDGWRLRG